VQVVAPADRDNVDACPEVLAWPTPESMSSCADPTIPGRRMTSCLRGGAPGAVGVDDLYADRTTVLDENPLRQPRKLAAQRPGREMVDVTTQTRVVAQPLARSCMRLRRSVDRRVVVDGSQPTRPAVAGGTAATLRVVCAVTDRSSRPEGVARVSIACTCVAEGSHRERSCVGVQVVDADGPGAPSAQARRSSSRRVVGSAQLLMLSGVATPSTSRTRLDVVADLPVGDNLHDHMFHALTFHVSSCTHKGTRRTRPPA